jgi:hypothetical protein
MEDVGRVVGVDVFTTLGLVREWFISELEREPPGSAPQFTIINASLEPPLFAVSYLTPKIRKRCAEPGLGNLLRQMNDTVVGLLSELSFESEWKESNFEYHKGTLSKHYYYWLEIRKNYYLESRHSLRGRVARLIGSDIDVEVSFLRPVLEANLQDETFKIGSGLIQKFTETIVRKTHEISLRCQKLI